MPALTKQRDSGGRFVLAPSPANVNLVNPASPIIISPGATWVLIGFLQCGNSKGYLAVDVAVAVAALTNFKVTRSIYEGGHDNQPATLAADMLVDTDFNTPTIIMPNCSPSNPHTTAAGSRFQFLLDVQGVAEYGFWAKSGGTAQVILRANFSQDFNQ